MATNVNWNIPQDAPVRWDILQKNYLGINNEDASRVPRKMLEMRVVGYIHQIQRELKIENVGDLVIFTCLQFMSMSEEYFSSCRNRDIKTSNYDYTVTRTSRKSWCIGGDPWGNFAIGNNIIDTRYILFIILDYLYVSNSSLCNMH